jgi:hypothetical protein
MFFLLSEPGNDERINIVKIGRRKKKASINWVYGCIGTKHSQQYDTELWGREIALIHFQIIEIKEW